LEHRGEPAQVAHRDRIVEAELGTEVHAYLRRHVGIGGELLEGVTGGEREDREQDQADPREDGEHDQQAPQHVPGHLSGATGARGPVEGRPRPGSYASLYQYARFQKSESQPLRTSLSLALTAATLGRHATGIATTFLITRSFIWMKRAARFTGSSSVSAAR